LFCKLLPFFSERGSNQGDEEVWGKEINHQTKPKKGEDGNFYLGLEGRKSSRHTRERRAFLAKKTSDGIRGGTRTIGGEKGFSIQTNSLAKNEGFRVLNEI